MSIYRFLLRLALGRRLPVLSGELRVPGLTAPVMIRRDSAGVPHIEAQNDADAAYSLGFCQGQDRAGQLEVYWRVGRGQLAEWVGKEGLRADRMSRRIGFRRSAERQVAALSPAAREQIEAFARGVSAGVTHGLPEKPHEFALVGGEPSAWDAADVLASLKLVSFLLPSNWDVEIARLRILLNDGPAALTALDPLYPDGHTITNDPAPHGQSSGTRGERSVRADAATRVADLLAADLAAILGVLPRGGGSNNWVVGGSHTASGKPLLANDPHLGPTVPSPWYLAHVSTPEWATVGAGFVGTPAVAIGHNGSSAWGVTAGLTDNADLFLETLGPDGTSVREADGSFTPCEVIREVIRVKGEPDVVEEILATPRGPIVSPLFPDLGSVAISLRAVWLDPLPVWGFLGVARSNSFEEFRQNFHHWPVLPLNVVYAHADGTIGWQLIGQVPRRKSGYGLLPTAADLPNMGWENELVPFAEMPHVMNPAAGFLATANNAPTAIGTAPFLGVDFIDGYRAAVIRDELGKRSDWDSAACGALQTNVRSLPWEEMRPIVLSLTTDQPDAKDALQMLREWDGHVEIDSAAATIFELFVAAMCQRVAKAKAPKSWRAALGEAGLGESGHNLFADRRVGHLVRLIRHQPEGWFERSWSDEMLDALGGTVQRLRRDAGPGPAFWGWGHIRALKLLHPIFGKHKLLGRVFNLGPVPCGGDMNTISQAGCRPLEVTDDTHNMANLRVVFDLADLARSRFVMCGGQSGNPLSPNYADQLPLWQAGEAVAIACDQAGAIRTAKQTLRLLPIPPKA